MSLTEALKLLPGVAPNKSKKQLKSAIIGECMQPPSNSIGEFSYEPKELKEMYIEDYSGISEIIRITPEGAKKLILIYKRKSLPLKPNGKVEDPLEALMKYSESASIYKQAALKEKEKIAKRKYLLANPDKIQENDFSYQLLDSVFWEKFGPIHGSYTLQLAGINVTKSVCLYKSNSGRTCDHEVSISWIGSDGKKHELSSPSRYKNNRRSDPERNWGLGRE